MKIFLIIFDTLRKDHTGKTYGNEWIQTPNFDLFAKDCLVFDKAYPESLPTIPVRRSIHTGMRTFPFNHEKPNIRSGDFVASPGWQPIPQEHTHLSEYLASEAYTTAFIASTYHHFKPSMNFHLGFNQWRWIRGHENDPYRAMFRKGHSKLRKKMRTHTTKKDPAARTYQKHVLKDYLCNVQDRQCEEEFFPAQTINAGIEFTIDSLKSDKTFLFLDEFDPHEPWDPPQRFLDLYLDKNYNEKRVITDTYRTDLDYLTEGELNFMRAAYAGEVSCCDYWFGQFVEELKRLEIYDDSLIILTSDHGHSIGEHNAIGKIPMYLYPELIDIPLMIKPPGNLTGPKRIKKSYVSTLDILPTLFGFMDKESPANFDGYDLSIFADDTDYLIDNRNYFTCGMNIYTVYKDDKYALITSNDKSDQKLFDLSKDPEWNLNIAENNPDICENLFEKIKKDANGDLLLSDEGQYWDLENWYTTKDE
ncbi:MAG: sulfatase-like hydrolase/transferase [Candidatus Lokiarchaeota archaeon]|nr:sulfatase-like hydrolase/transferase [Candidatus Lokiarchaeota archaeon]MBD3340463.1 sulfatase-like hydrolase/transferase [Candidatus Lokiarchaeota archaeon]